MNKQLKDQEKDDALKSAAASIVNDNNAIREAARLMGGIGGRSGRGDSKRRDSEMCRQAVAKRWENYRRRKANSTKGTPQS